MNNYKSLIVISSPSGGGKSTIAKHLMNLYPSLDFSVSATTRKKREGEIDNKDYFFLTKEEFLEKIKQNDLIEYEEIFGNLYGTLKSEVSKSIDTNKTILFDVDVKGALSLKKHFPNQTLLIFIAPPNLEVLEDRLRKRRTETEEEINRRLDRAEEEDKYRDKFDELIINDNLEESFRKIEEISNKHLNPELKQKG
jgi:guanylate kinase